MNNTDLPQGWTAVKLNDLVSSALGGDWGVDPENIATGFVKVRVIRGTEFKTWRKDKGATAAERCIKASSLEKRHLEKGDIVLEVSGGGPTQPVGRTVLIDSDALRRSSLPLVCSNFFRLLRLYPALDACFVQYFLTYEYANGAFNEYQTETTNLRNLNVTDFLRKTEVCVAPLSEQHRIVAKLDELLGKTEACRERLERIPATMRRFRQSVLDAACSGRLTADWREVNHSVEGAFDLMREISKARTTTSVVELVPTALCPQDSIPATWAWVKFGSIIGELRNGVSLRPNIEPPGVPILRISATRPGSVDLAGIRYMPNGEDFLPNYAIRDNDLLFTRYNGSVEFLGVCGMVRGLGKKTVLYPDKLMRVRFDHEYVLPTYAEIFFQAPSVHERIVAMAKSSAGQNGVSGSDIKGQPFALAPLAEQQEIIGRVGALFAQAERIEARFDNAYRVVEKLTQSILRKAFRGGLVSTEAELAQAERREFESAEQLLVRVRESLGVTPIVTKGNQAVKRTRPKLLANR